jgi:hypothetical protein
MHQIFLQERANDLANTLHTTEAKALQAIKKAEE